MSEKTEQPTDKKIRDSRKKGQVCYSKDATSAFILLCLFSIMIANAPVFQQRLSIMFQRASNIYLHPFEEAVIQLGSGLLSDMIVITVPFVATLLLGGLMIGFVQVGPLLALQALKPDLKKFNPATNLKNMFGKKKMADFLLSLIKATCITIVAWLVIRNELGDLIEAPNCGLNCIATVLGSSISHLIFIISGLFIVLASTDYLIKYKLYIKDLMMTKDEVKREFKESEGDPLIKSKRKQIFQEIVMSNVQSKVKDSSVVVSNPTHRAVALKYKRGETPLPIVHAKGSDMIARFIIKVAKDNDIPVMQDIPLAHALHAVDINHYVPSELIDPVAAIFRWLASIKSN